MNSLILKDIERYNYNSRNTGSILKKNQFNSDKSVAEHPFKIKNFLTENFLEKKISKDIKSIKKGIKIF